MTDCRRVCCQGFIASPDLRRSSLACFLQQPSQLRLHLLEHIRRFRRVDDIRHFIGIGLEIVELVHLLGILVLVLALIAPTRYWWKHDATEARRTVREGTDPLKPRLIESQSSFLKRHDLFLEGEERQLTAEDFEPELVDPSIWSSEHHGGSKNEQSLNY